MAAAFTWETAPPAEHGMDPGRLEAMREGLARRGSDALLILRHDKVVFEWYRQGQGPTVRHYTASLAKALVGGMSLLLAMEDGRLSPDDPAAKHIPSWREDARRSKITLRHLATHTSGIEDAEEPGKAHNQLTGWKGAFWKRDPDPFTLALAQAPVLFEPGTRYAYSNPGMAALAYAVTAGLRGAPQSDIRSLLKERLMDPMGVPAGEWSIGYGRAYEVDGLKLWANWGGGAYSPRAAAAVGRLLLRKGDWDGRRLVSAMGIQRALAYAGMPLPERPAGNPPPGSGLAWYTNFDGVWPEVPRDAFAGAGAGNQVLIVIPSLDLVAVRFGAQIGSEKEGLGFWGGLERFLFNPLVAAAADRPQAALAPYPPSPVIAGIEWAPVETIVRKAKGSDNWPLTWADDGHLYTAYGDGNGFEPHLPEKLSLGFARVEGMPEAFTGVNVRSAGVEQRGDGRSGKKASGILMIDGVLYLWARNAGNSQLASSRDHGRAWRWADWRFTSGFGCPTFLNFGRSYAGARDDTVYVYSLDSETAYEPADRMLLARVPKERILERDAYEFFASLDAQGKPAWTRDIEKRGAVFEHAGRCYRSSVTYNAGLKRYLWWQVIPGGDTRFKGGFGVYDAPEPWGPWTTAFFTEEWDVGPGESASFPSKWMSADGRTLHLVFSGDDHFSVRRATIRPAGDQRIGR